MKVILGAGNTSYDGWISTQENELNLLCRADFEHMFPDGAIIQRRHDRKSPKSRHLM